jgi:hypothetical protein
LYEKYKTAWQTLAENKKLKYIKLAIEAKKKYDVSNVFFTSSPAVCVLVEASDVLASD